MWHLTLALLALSVAAVLGAADDDLAKAAAALKNNRPNEAVDLAGKAIEADPKNPRAYLIRGVAHEALEQHGEAVADFTRALELDPELAEAYNHRGSERLKLGQIPESIADFDAYLKRNPQETPGHWKRGIACYYAGRYDDGARQFEGYEKIDTNDVENAVWRYLCMARVVGVEKARAAMLKVGKDPRVPLMVVYDLFLGRKKPEDVLAAAKAGAPSPEQLNERLFYAELYLGLYYDSVGEKAKAIEHLTDAVEKHRLGHYMWDIARVHRDRLRREGK